MAPAPQRPPLHHTTNNGSQPPLAPPRNTTRRPRRQRYNTVAISDVDDDTVNDFHNSNNTEDDDVEEATTVTSNTTNENDDDDDTADRNRTHHHRRQRQPLYAAIPTSTSSPASSSIVMDVTILDFSHKRWPIQITADQMAGTAAAGPTVYDLKHIGATVHNIPMLQQRLIYQGRLLNDDSVPLLSLGIQKSGSIVHLFPKPRVVVVDHHNNNNNNSNNNNSSTTETPLGTATTTNTNSSSGSSTNHNNNEESNSNNNGGAHVPVIVMDQSEVDRRSEILVLGHADYVEAVSNVKLFSLMLLIISTIELLHLLSLYITPPQTNSNHSNYYNSNNGDGFNSANHVHEDDTFFNDDQFNATALNNTSTDSSAGNVIDTITAGGASAIDPIDRILDQWTPIKYVDLIISIVGIYVSILGMRASNENCLRTARYYLIGTTITAIGWLTYNYIISYEIDVEVDAHPEKYYGTYGPYDDATTATTYSDDAIGESYGSSSSSSSSSHAGYDSNHTESPYDQAFSAMILPGMVWGLCIFRAWQFHNVLSDAEREAAERTNTMMMDDDDNDTATVVDTDGGGDVELSSTRPRPGDDPVHSNATRTGTTNHPSPPVVGMMA